MQNIAKRLDIYFKDLTFHEGSHTYTINSKNLPSVSGLIKNYYEPFNSNGISKNMAKNGELTAVQLRSKWKTIADEACARGNRVHNFGELYPFDRNLKPSCKQEEAVALFWNNLPSHIVPVVMELRMYHKEFGYAGTADIILYDMLSNSLVIGDYKTNKDLFKNYKQKKMLTPFIDLLDCPFNKYQLQLSYYQILLEQSGYKVSGRKLIWLKKNGTYDLFDTNDYTQLLIKELKLTA